MSKQAAVSDLAIGALDPSVASTNVGDRIIMEACQREIEAARPRDQCIHFSALDTLTLYSLREQRRSIKWNVLCGTNCLSSHMLLRSGWGVNLLTAPLFRPVTTMGVGWGSYQGRPDLYTRVLLRKLLGVAGVLSVRDAYTQKKMHECGLSNVMNTGCPTIWGLDEAHCLRIPRTRAAEVVYTLTSYAPNAQHDLQAIRHLTKAYSAVHIWFQGTGDPRYFKTLLPEIRTFMDPDRINVVPPVLGAYDALLETRDLDYVGTRLHGGIRAMQRGKRALILAVDNRAMEMGRDFNLPVIPRDRVGELPGLIIEERATDVRLPSAAIEAFRAFLRTDWCSTR